MSNQVKLDKQDFQKNFNIFFKQKHKPQLSLQNKQQQQNSSISSPIFYQSKQLQKGSHKLPTRHHKYTHKIPHQQPKTIFQSFINSLLLILFLFFMIDLYFQIQKQLESKENQIKKCYEEYNINNCEQPIDALIQQCQQYQNCSKMDAMKELGYSKILINTLFSLFGLMINHLGITGIIVLILVMIVYLFRPKRYAEYTLEKTQ